MEKTTEALVCADCGTHIPQREGALGGPACGWTFDEPRRPICYGCCAKRDAADQLRRVRGISVDGDFQNQTQTAVRNFQAVKGLTVDGIAGQQTRQALVALKDL